jgi:hypothetical protein
VIVITRIIIKHAKVKRTAAMHHVKHKRSIGPWKPPGRKTVVNSIGLCHGVFVNRANESVRLVPEEATCVEVRKVVASEDFKIDAT